MGDETQEWVGQGLALLLVAGLIGLVVWFAQGYDANKPLGTDDAESAESADDGGGIGDGQAESSTDQAEDGAEAIEDAPFVSTGHHRAYFGAVVDEVEGMPYAVGDGCVLAVVLKPGPSVDGMKLLCGDATTTRSAPELHEGPAAAEELHEALTPDGSAYSLRYTSGDSSARRLSIDTTSGRLLIREGDGRATLLIDAFSVPRPGAPFDPAADGSATFEVPEGDCDPESRWSGALVTVDEELSPLTLGPAADGSGPRLELFDARAAPITEINVDCEAGTAVMTGERASYQGRFGPQKRSILGRATFLGEPALFFLLPDE